MDSLDDRTSGEFLSLVDLGVPADEDSSPVSPQSDSGRPDLDAIFADFSRLRPRQAQRRHSDHPRSMEIMRASTPSATGLRPKTDLRALDYVSDYDSHLMCDICHVPFIEPVVLECDHTFCSDCYEDYRISHANTARIQCPTCRSFSSAKLRKASRLITNMCNDILVRCPNQGCEKAFPRSCIDQHARLDCEEERLPCPDSTCAKLTKRRDLNSDDCKHKTHIYCECGQLIELGKGDWLKHKDEECPLNSVQCEQCQEQIASMAYLASSHVCGTNKKKCPGIEFGCDATLEDEDCSSHLKSCTFAKLAPYFDRQAQLLASAQQQLAVAKVRNEVLEAGFDRINDLIHDQILPKLDNADVEEIERIPSPASAARDMLLPAHLRALTPSPSLDHASQQHLLALHESLRGSVASIEADISHLATNIADLDARSSMQIMNETLRIKEDLAHANAALFSTRAQVQWLLNRERMGQQQRGRASAAAAPSTVETTAGPSSAGPSSAVASVSNTPMLRPVRRLSGGSQERVKL